MPLIAVVRAPSVSSSDRAGDWDVEEVVVVGGSCVVVAGEETPAVVVVGATPTETPEVGGGCDMVSDTRLLALIVLIERRL